MGASGSGCTSIGRVLAERLKCPSIDSDDFYWETTDPPFITKRAVEERDQKILGILRQHDHWVLAGSITGWDEEISSMLSLAVFVNIPPEIRMKRLEEREKARYGQRVALGGDMYEVSLQFLEWAKHYDSGHLPGRTRAKHQAWFDALSCKKMILLNTGSLEEAVNALISDPAFTSAHESTVVETGIAA
jgi:adenylate kinase family enzyme